jgi:hypothetical protein
MEKLSYRRQTTVRSKAFHFENWVREILIQTFVDPGATVCELLCDKGQDIGKLQRAQIRYYIAVDAEISHLNEAKRLWRAKREPFLAEFVCADPSKDTCIQVGENS